MPGYQQSIIENSGYIDERMSVVGQQCPQCSHLRTMVVLGLPPNLVKSIRWEMYFFPTAEARNFSDQNGSIFGGSLTPTIFS
jgi:hypothetical protein